MAIAIDSRSTGLSSSRTVESPFKRRRISVTRAIDISPIKITTEDVRLSSKSQDGQLGVGSALDVPARGGASLRAFVMDGPVDEDIYDFTHIGTEQRRQGPSPRSLKSALKKPTSNRGHRFAASPARSLRPGSVDLASKDNRQADTASVGDASEDQENLQTEFELTDATDRINEDRSRRITRQDRVFEMDLTATDDVREPDLPTLPIPQVPGPDSASPQGLLSSSPSGRRVKRLNKKSLEQDGKLSNKDSGSQQIKRSKEWEEEEQVQMDAEQEEVDTASAHVPTDASGPIVTWDCAVEQKQKEFEKLRRRRAKLEAEITLLESGLPGRERIEDRKGRDGDLQLLRALISGPSKIAEDYDSSRGLAAVSDQLSQFLPFTTNVSADTSLPARTGQASTRPSSQLEFTASFSPFKISLLSYQVVSAPQAEVLEVKQVIRLLSPDQVLDMRLELVIQPVLGTITHLRLTGNNSPISSQFVASFLGQPTFRNSDASSITVMALALGQTWGLACTRAETWAALASEHQELLEDDLKPHKDIASTSSSSSSQHSLHLARRALCMQNSTAAVLFDWQLVSDSSGEVRSEVDACITDSTTSSSGNDDLQRFNGVGELFHLLVQRHGFRSAANIVIELIFGAKDGTQARLMEIETGVNDDSDADDDDDGNTRNNDNSTSVEDDHDGTSGGEDTGSGEDGDESEVSVDED